MHLLYRTLDAHTETPYTALSLTRWLYCSSVDAATAAADTGVTAVGNDNSVETVATGCRR